MTGLIDTDRYGKRRRDRERERKRAKYEEPETYRRNSATQLQRGLD